MTEDEFDTIAKNTFDNEFTQELIERIRTRKSILRASTVNQPEYIATWSDRVLPPTNWDRHFARVIRETRKRIRERGNK